MTNDVKTPEDRLYDKVAALLRKAESTTAEEAELLMGKAEELIAKYALDELRVRSALGYAGPDDPLGRDWVEFRFKTQWKEDASLLNCLAKPNGCAVVTSTKYMPRDGRYVEVRGAYLFGTESGRKHTMWMYTSMLVTVTRLQRSAGDSWPQRRSFRIGFADGLYKRMNRAKNEAVTAAGSDMLPILQSEADKLAAYIAEQIGKTRTNRGGRLDGRAFRAGQAAANGVDVGDAKLPGRRTAIGAGS